MSELDELYQEVILDHNRSPRNFRTMAQANRKAQGYNPLCGDQVTVYLQLEGGVIKDISFQGSGCAISKASASMMTAELRGKSEKEARELFENVHDMLTGHSNGAEQESRKKLGKLTILSGVSKFPARVKCASLAWHTVNSALNAEQEVVSTE
ncbi:MAG TPA: SUF system NifU family Fe-S cluster assembly protein [Candidatus Binatia bacterium]|jgi:nitrogen fixation protein NifU and related proteins|nr:SUF system NifU family Fe-S cluster assembly protein [Candidatus Binatia bacterium]